MEPVTAPAVILLVTVTDVETEAVLRAFERETGRKPAVQARGRKTYHHLGVVNGSQVWQVRSEMGSGSLGAAQQTVAKAIAALQPAAIIMVGIAFGTRPKQQAIGDVLVSQRLAPYELQWVGTVKQRPKAVPFGSKPDASPWLLDAFRTARRSWQPAANPPPAVHFGLVLTGEKLVDNLAFRKQLCALESDALGGEMEAAGLYVACHDQKVDWLLVKAICDWADGKKEKDRAARQQLAAANAAEIVLHTLKTVPLIGNPSAPQTAPMRPRKATAAAKPVSRTPGNTGIRSVAKGRAKVNNFVIKGNATVNLHS